MENPVPPGEPGHGGGRISLRRLAGRVRRDPLTDEWAIPFEVICPDCGDDGGRYDAQPEAIRAVRGPYPDAAAARAAVARHAGRA